MEQQGCNYTLSALPHPSFPPFLSTLCLHWQIKINDEDKVLAPPCLSDVHLQHVRTAMSSKYISSMLWLCVFVCCAEVQVLLIWSKLLSIIKTAKKFLRIYQTSTFRCSFVIKFTSIMFYFDVVTFRNLTYHIIQNCFSCLQSNSVDLNHCSYLGLEDLTGL